MIDAKAMRDILVKSVDQQQMDTILKSILEAAQSGKNWIIIETDNPAIHQELRNREFWIADMFREQFSQPKRFRVSW